MLDFIIYFGVVTIASMISFDYNYLLKLITLDSVFSAIHFLKTFINKELSNSQILSKANSLYDGSALDRYIYYTILHLSYILICIFFWMDNSYILYYIGLITIIPNIINKILTSKLFQLIKDKKETAIKVIIAKIFTGIIKFYSKLYLEKDIKIKYGEITVLLKSYKDTINYFLEVLKNLLVILGLSYIKNYSASLYYSIIKYVYNYKTGDMLESYNSESAKNHLTNIIDNKKWYELTKPNTYKAMLYLYQMNNDKSDIFRQIMNEFNISLVKMFTIWTIGSLCGYIYIVPLLSSGFFLFQKYIRKGIINDYQQIPVLLLGLLTCYFYPSYPIVSGICQFGKHIIFNKLSHVAIKMLWKKVKKLTLKIVINNGDLIISHFVTILYAIVLKSLVLAETHIIVTLNILANILMSIEVKKQIVFGMVLSSTYLSNYDIRHVVFNSITLYVFLGLIDKFDTYTLQDFVVSLTDKFINLIKIAFEKMIHIFTYIINYYNLIRTQVRDNTKYYVTSIFSQVSDEKSNKLIFELMDTDKFPSASLTNSDIIKTKTKIEEMNLINVNNINDSVSIDDEVFNQSDDEFINGISVDENADINKYKPTINKPDINYPIINDYYK